MLQPAAIDWRTLPRLTRSRSNEQKKVRGTHVLRRSALVVWPETFVLQLGTSPKSIWPNKERVSKAFSSYRSKIHIYRGSRADFLNRHGLRRISLASRDRNAQRIRTIAEFRGFSLWYISSVMLLFLEKRAAITAFFSELVFVSCSSDL